MGELLKNKKEWVTINQNYFISKEARKAKAQQKKAARKEYWIKNKKKTIALTVAITATVLVVGIVLMGVLAPLSASVDGFAVRLNDDGTVAIKYYDGDDSVVKIPSKIWYLGKFRDVTQIGRSAFSHQLNMTQIVIPDSITYIDSWAFYDCVDLTSIAIPNSVTYIGDNILGGCKSLTSVSVPFIGESRKGAYNYAFGYLFGATSYNTHRYVIPESLEHVTITNDDDINSLAFGDCYLLKSITILDGVTSIGNSAFSGCLNIETIDIPNSVSYIGKSAFSSCLNIETIDIPEDVRVISDYTFYGCESLIDVVIPDSVQTIGTCAFYKCESLTNVVIPDNVKTIGSGAFYSCDSLTDIKIGDSVTEIGDNAFYDCSNITNLYIPKSLRTTGEYVFFGCYCINVFYSGSMAEWNSIEFGYGSGVPHINIYFNYTEV